MPLRYEPNYVYYVILLPAATNLWQGNVYTHVCLSQWRLPSEGGLSSGRLK